MIGSDISGESESTVDGDMMEIRSRDILEILRLAMAILPRGGEMIRWMMGGQETLVMTKAQLCSVEAGWKRQLG